MTTWGELSAANPELAEAGREILYRSGSGEALLVTVRGQGLPQVHPISVRIDGQGLYAFMLPSSKLRDLEEDGRYALHAVFDPAAPDEFTVRGRVRPVSAAARDDLATRWSWNVLEAGAVAFEFLIDEALLGRRAPDDWPPVYTRWSDSVRAG